MPKYWGKQIFSLVKSKRRREKKRKEKRRLNDGDNNGQATHGARMAHAWRTHGARKPPGPIHLVSPPPFSLYPCSVYMYIPLSMQKVP